VHRRISDGVLRHAISTGETTYSCSGHTAYKIYFNHCRILAQKNASVLQKNYMKQAPLSRIYHSIHARTVENSFGILTTVWSILGMHRPTSQTGCS
jgi:hypothetical protein